MMNVKANALLIYLVLFPYVSLISLPMDTAPYSVVVLAAYIPFLSGLFGRTATERLPASSINSAILAILVGFCLVLLVRLMTFGDTDTFRVMANYLSFLLFYLFFVILLGFGDRAKDQFLRQVGRALHVGAYFYLGASLLQLAARTLNAPILFDLTNALLSADISRRSTFDRGFNSLAAEPSYAGITAALFALLCIFLNRQGYMSRGRLNRAFVCYLLTGALSLSATAIPFLVISFYAFLLTYSSVKRTVLLTLSLVAAGYAIPYALEHSDSRLARLVELIWVGGFYSLMTQDVSFISRLASPINYSLSVVSGNNVFGSALVQDVEQHLISSIRNSDYSQTFKSSLFVGLYAEGGTLRTKSAIGQSLFLFGMFAILFWSLLIFNIMRRAGARMNAGGGVMLLVILGYLVQVPLGHPSFCFAIGLVLLGLQRRTAAGPSTLKSSPPRPVSWPEAGRSTAPGFRAAASGLSPSAASGPHR